MGKKKKPLSQHEIDKMSRRDWGGVNPASQYFRDKTKFRRKEKYKKDYLAEECSEEKKVEEY